MPPRKAKKAAAAPAKPALDGCRIALSGTFPKPTSQAQLKAKAEALGATVSSTVADDVTQLVATEADFQKTSAKVAKAQALGIPIVSMEWLQSCEDKKAKLPEKDFSLEVSDDDDMDDGAQPAAPSQTQASGPVATGRGANKRAASPAPSSAVASAAPKAKKPRSGKKAAGADANANGDDADQVKKTDAEVNGGDGADKQPTKSKANPTVGKGQVAKSTDIQIPLDEGCPYATSTVYIDPDGVIYDAALNQTNSTANNNKFYRIQVRHSPQPALSCLLLAAADRGPSSWWIPREFTGCGRAGVVSASTARPPLPRKDPYSSL